VLTSKTVATFLWPCRAPGSHGEQSFTRGERELGPDPIVDRSNLETAPHLRPEERRNPKSGVFVTPVLGARQSTATCTRGCEVLLGDAAGGNRPRGAFAAQWPRQRPNQGRLGAGENKSLPEKVDGQNFPIFCFGHSSKSQSIGAIRLHALPANTAGRGLAGGVGPSRLGVQHAGSAPSPTPASTRSLSPRSNSLGLFDMMAPLDSPFPWL
jgi:hypothetical protein